ncbi:xylulokinase [uncultured Salinisphaera sp.]|uniref:xylulokinase n=1 Tax=uncultured Salinisphaera sp. TaxID=359372 RepID=UPI0032B1950F|tara:strand:- start:6926 stop:8440 length:1515 start_codon:yes stop_codon:yes gene_type:complete
MANPADQRFIGLDIGTSSAKGVAVDAGGAVIARASADYPLLTPKPGWTEQNPEDWWQAACEVLKQLIAAIPGPVEAIGLTGQMHGAVFLDAAGDVIRPAILWNDQRTSAACADIEARVGQTRLREITGNPALTGFQAPKIIWLRDNEPEHYARLAHVLLPKDYIRYRLSGVFVTDASDAAGTLLLDLAARDWSEEILAALELPRAWLPDVFEGPEICAHVTAAGAGDSGLPADTPIVAGAGDNAGAAVGGGIVDPDTALVSIGTSGVVFAHSDTASPDASGELHCFCHAVPGAYHLMGVSLASGGSLAWFAQKFAQDEAGVAERLGVNLHGLLADEAATVAPGADDLYFLPYLAGERTPHMDANARGAWIGLTLSHDKRHMIRAILEGVAFSLRDSLTRIEAQRVVPQRLLLGGGGAHSPVWRAIIAAVLDKPVAVQRDQEGPAYGATLLAAVGAGVYADVNAAVAAMVTLPDDFEQPDPELVAAYTPRYETFTRLYPALRDAL